MKSLRFISKPGIIFFGILLLFTTLPPLQAQEQTSSITEKIFKADLQHETKVTFNNLEITVPAGALETETDLSVSWGDPDYTGIQKPWGFMAISKPFQFGPHGTRFKEGKPLKFKLKINPEDLPPGYSLYNARLFYINRELGRLEPVAGQSINPQTGILEAPFEHFSEYVPGVTSLWDGNGLNPFMDFISNGEEHVLVNGRQLSILSPVYSLKGRGLDLNLERAYSLGPITSNWDSPFSISTNWYWSGIYVWGNKLYMPGGASYRIPATSTSSRIISEGTSFEVYRDNGIITLVRLHDGTTIKAYPSLHYAYPDYQTITDPNGNYIRYNFKKIVVNDNTWLRVASIIDSAGRAFILEYGTIRIRLPNYADYYDVPILSRMTLNGKTILSLTATLVNDRIQSESFTDALNRKITYNYNYMEVPYNYINYITSIIYPNGVKSQYLYETPHYENFPKIKTQSFYRPGEGSPARTVEYKEGDYFNTYQNCYLKATVVSDESTCRKYFFNDLGTTSDEEIGSPDRLFKVHHHDYYTFRYWENFNGREIKTTRPMAVTTKAVLADGTLVTTGYSEYAYDEWGNVVMEKDIYGNVTRWLYQNTFYMNNTTGGNFAQYGYQDPLYKSSSGTWYNRPATRATKVYDPIHNTYQLSQVHYQYDGKGNLLKERVVYGNVYLDTNYTYDSYGNLLTKTDPKGNTLCFEYSPAYGSAYLTRIYKPDGATLA
ncbi:MAG: hypothetical protein K6U80_10160, partial [Firmicutes bacterium]|nr:hypothetical protein [Bacillota bacterium]